MGSSDARAERRALKKRIEATLTAHPCGECSACCTVKAVKEIQKEEGVPCQHLGRHSPTMEKPTTRGCKIYAKRPVSCRDYFCGYRFGLVFDDVRFRPDVLGIVFDIAERPPPGVRMMLTAREVTPNAIEERMEELHEIVSQGMVVYLIQGDKRRFIGPEEQVKICIDFARKSLPLWVPKE